MSDEGKSAEEVGETHDEQPSAVAMGAEPLAEAPVDEEPAAADDFWKAPSETSNPSPCSPFASRPG